MRRRGRERESFFVVVVHTFLTSAWKIDQKAGIPGTGLHGPIIGKNGRGKRVLFFFRPGPQNQCAQRTRNREMNHCALTENLPLYLFAPPSGSVVDISPAVGDDSFGDNLFNSSKLILVENNVRKKKHFLQIPKVLPPASPRLWQRTNSASLHVLPGACVTVKEFPKVFFWKDSHFTKRVHQNTDMKTAARRQRSGVSQKCQNGTDASPLSKNTLCLVNFVNLCVCVCVCVGVGEHRIFLQIQGLSSRNQQQTGSYKLCTFHFSHKLKKRWILNVSCEVYLAITHLFMCLSAYMDYCVAVWLCDCVAVWLRGCVTVWLCDCVAVWLRGCVTAWLSDCVAVWLRGCLTARLYDCAVVWLRGCLTAHLSDCAAVCLRGCLTAWLPDCAAVWLCGCVEDSCCVDDWIKKFLNMKCLIDLAATALRRATNGASQKERRSATNRYQGICSVFYSTFPLVLVPGLVSLLRTHAQLMLSSILLSFALSLILQLQVHSPFPASCVSVCVPRTYTIGFPLPLNNHSISCVGFGDFPAWLPCLTRWLGLLHWNVYRVIQKKKKKYCQAGAKDPLKPQGLTSLEGEPMLKSNLVICYDSWLPVTS